MGDSVWKHCETAGSIVQNAAAAGSVRCRCYGCFVYTDLVKMA